MKLLVVLVDEHMVDDGQSGDDTCIFPGLPYLKPIGQVTTALWVLFGFSKSRYCSERELSHFLELIKIELDLFLFIWIYSGTVLPQTTGMAGCARIHLYNAVTSVSCCYIQETKSNNTRKCSHIWGA